MEEILQKAKKLFETEQQYLKIIGSALFDDPAEIIKLIMGAVALVDEIKLALVEHDPDCLEIEDENLRNTLKKIREGERFESVKAFETLREYVKSNSTNNDAFELEISDFSENHWDDLLVIFHSRFDLNSYFSGKLQVGQIITSYSIPSDLKDKFYELREAYAYNLHQACIALCRMLLEISLVDCLKKIKSTKVH